MSTIDQEVPSAKEVSYEDALAEQETSQEPVAGEQQEENDVADLLRPKATVKTWKIGPPGIEREYTQRPLSFVSKIQWFSLVGEVLDRSMTGPNAMSIGSLLSAPQGRGGTLSMSDFRDADTFVQAIGKLITYAPDFLLKSYIIWLAIPDYEQEVAIEMMKATEEDGGLSDDDGIEIIETFIDQNYEAIDRFFREKLSRLRDRVEARQKEAAIASPPSKR